MAITLQGAWTLRVSARHPGSACRFLVSGAEQGNGSFDAQPGTAVPVSGTQWTVALQRRPGAQGWQEVPARIGFPAIAGGLLRFEIRAGDGSPGDDADPLVLSCSLPASACDHVLYGAVTAYAGPCLFNPGRDDLVVIDPPYRLRSLCERFPPLGEVLTKLHPERLRRLARPDPEPELTPLVLPTGLPVVANGLVFRSALPQAPLPWAGDTPEQHEARAVRALQLGVRRTAFMSNSMTAGLRQLDRSDLESIAVLRHAGLRQQAPAQRAAGVRLRFQAYARTACEQRGSAYTGTGQRQELGTTVTDALGHYLFRFQRPPLETAPDTAATPQRPDVIVQRMGAGLAARFETAPFNSVANLQRIDLCMAQEEMRPVRGCPWERLPGGRSAVAALSADAACSRPPLKRSLA